MRIGIDIEPISSDQAGIGYYTQNLVEHLGQIDRKNNYFLYCRAIPDLRLPDNFEYVVITPGEPLWQPAVGVDSIQRGLDVYHSTHSVQIPAFGLLQQYRQVLTVHDLSSYDHPEWFGTKERLLAKFLPLALRRVNQVIVPTQWVKDELLHRFSWLVPSKITVTYEAVSGIFKPGGVKIPSQVSFVGTLEPRKNITMILRAMSLLRDTDIKLKIAGKKGWFYDEIFETVKKLAITDQVEFLGYISDQDKVKLMQQSAVFVYPSLYEGFGLPVVEAMACGTPVVTSRGGTLEEVTGGAAVLVNPNSSEEIAQAILRLANDHHYAAELTKKGLKRVREFSWEKTARETLQVYATR